MEGRISEKVWKMLTREILSRNQNSCDTYHHFLYIRLVLPSKQKRETVCITIANEYDSNPEKKFVKKDIDAVKRHIETIRAPNAIFSLNSLTLSSSFINNQLRKNIIDRNTLESTMLLGNISEGLNESKLAKLSKLAKT